METRNHQRWHRRIRAAAGGCTVLVLVLMTLSVLPLPHKAAEPNTWSEAIEAHRPGVETRQSVDTWFEAIGRRSLFKPAVPLPARRMAGQTVERVRGMVRLNAILVKDDQPIAYLRIKDIGLRPFKVGDRIEGLFAVTRIDTTSVELEIAGERIRLDL